MALRFSRDLDLKQAGSQFSILLCYAVALYPCDCLLFHFWNNFFCWLPYHHTLVSFKLLHWHCFLFFFARTPFSSRILNVGMSWLSTTHCCLLYLIFCSHLIFTHGLNPNHALITTCLLNIFTWMWNRHLRQHDWRRFFMAPNTPQILSSLPHLSKLIYHPFNYSDKNN